MKLIDLSVLVKNSHSEPMKIKIHHIEHHKGAKLFCKKQRWKQHLPFFKRLKEYFLIMLKRRKTIQAKDFPDSAFLSLDIVTLPTHMGTHIDAPYHYGPDSSGRVGKKVHELPIEWFYQDGVCLDLTHKKAGDYITQLDIQTCLERIGYALKPLDIVLIRTDNDKLWGKREYFFKAPGMSTEATEWLINQGIKVIGIDTYGFDRPFNVMLEAYYKTGDKSHLWPTHFLGRDKEYIQIERLANLDLLPVTGFKIICFPLRIDDIDASWVRAVAVIN